MREIKELESIDDEFSKFVSIIEDSGLGVYDLEVTERAGLYYRACKLLRPTAREWRPIETAPKDGTSVMLLVRGIAIQGTHSNFFSWWNVEKLPSHGCGCCGDTDPPPTHWMPLPKPPQEGT